LPGGGRRTLARRGKEHRKHKKGHPKFSVNVVSNEAHHVEQHTKSSDRPAHNCYAPLHNCNAAIWSAAVLFTLSFEGPPL